MTIEEGWIKVKAIMPERAWKDMSVPHDQILLLSSSKVCFLCSPSCKISCFVILSDHTCRDANSSGMQCDKTTAG